MMIKEFGDITGKLAVVIQILALTALVSCTAMGSATSATVCHATGDPANPYEEITVSGTELNEHIEHPSDINPAPSTGCPANLVVISNGKITFCHVNGSQANPYDEIIVSVNGLNGHGKHDGDVFPVSEEGCPANLVSGGKITICHATSSEKNPYNEITVSVNGLNGHNKHGGDIIPAPAGGCPTTGS